ncbi:PaaI family thioesterase [Corallincola platygyrae]|uniref:Acyl-coenzyme A thioesterase THEM4 n=1 Tax=Corallincola platygyrae TaxID=1193278 RepID=A0ABW4XH67_9GAMM
METQVAFQDQIPHNHCFGCGPNNAQGLQIKSYWQDDCTSICNFSALPHHSAGPKGYLNGGIISTLIDCHAICTSIADCYRENNQHIGEGPVHWCVTGELNVRYLAPAPIATPVQLIAKVTETSGKKRIIECKLYSVDQHDRTLCATASVVAIKVPESWLESSSRIE